MREIEAIGSGGAFSETEESGVFEFERDRLRLPSNSVFVPSRLSLPNSEYRPSLDDSCLRGCGSN